MTYSTPWHMYTPTPPRWARAQPGAKPGQRARLRAATGCSPAQARAQFEAFRRDQRVARHTMAWFTPRERRELEAHLRARNDLDREYQARFPDIPDAAAARYRPEGQAALDREVRLRRRAARTDEHARAEAWLRGAP